MSVAKKDSKKITVKTLQSMADKGEKIAMITAYDYSMATLVDMSGVDIVLVGDSAANVMAGYSTTLPITLNEMIYHAASVVRACKRALVVVDLPFGTYQGNSKEALCSAIRINKKHARFRFHRFMGYLKFGDEIYTKGMQVRHLDGNPLNNSWDNIAIGTQRDNTYDIPKEKRLQSAL